MDKPTIERTAVPSEGDQCSDHPLGEGDIVFIMTIILILVDVFLWLFLK